MPDNELLKSDYKPIVEIYPIVKPAIETGYIYHFTSKSGILYEIQFAKKDQWNRGIIVNFSVLDDAFENEYAVTNRGEIYNVIATVIEAVRFFHEHHPITELYEFSGEFKDSNDKQSASIRTRLYLRYAKEILSKKWNSRVEGNKVILEKIKK